MDILGVIDGHIGVAEGLKGVCVDIEAVCKVCGEAVLRGNKIILCGNGGSAADAQHIAAEFVGRFVKERRGLAALALTVDTSALTAIGNDYGFDEVFARQLSALGRAGDVFIGISTSGNSRNVVRAVEVGLGMGVVCVGLLGGSGGVLKGMVDLSVVVPSLVTARIQEMHILVGHIVCEYVDS